MGIQHLHNTTGEVNVPLWGIFRHMPSWLILRSLQLRPVGCEKLWSRIISRPPFTLNDTLRALGIPFLQRGGPINPRILKMRPARGCLVAMDIGTIEVSRRGQTMGIIPVQQPIKALPNILQPIIRVGMQWVESMGCTW